VKELFTDTYYYCFNVSVKKRMTFEDPAGRIEVGIGATAWNEARRGNQRPFQRRLKISLNKFGHFLSYNASGCVSTYLGMGEE